MPIVFAVHLGKGVVRQVNGGVLVEHVDGGQPATFADFKVVKIMRRSDFHRARPFFGVGIVVRHNRDKSPDNRQHNIFPDKVFIAFIVGVNRHAGIAQHGFGARGRDSNMPASVFQRIIKVPHMAIGFALLDFQIRDGRQQTGVPIHQTLIFVNQLLLIKRDENLQHGLRQTFIHGEAFAAPIARRAEAAQLTGNGRTAFFFPLPHTLEEFFAPHFAATFIALLGQLPLDNHLGGDARMVRAGLPQHIAPAHAFKAAQNILQRIVQRMAHMQAARHIGRRNNDGIRLGLRVLGEHATGFEAALIFPRLIEAGFNRGRVKSFIEFVIVSHNQSRAVTCS